MSLPMEKATYRARAVGAGFGISEKETHQLAITFALVDEHDAPTSEQITWIGHFTSTVDKKGKSVAQRTIDSLLYMGFESDDLTLLEEPSEDDIMKMLPNVVEIVCEPEIYNDVETLKVRWVNRPGAGRFAFKKPLKGAELKSFAAQMRGTLKNARGGAPSRPVSQPRHPNAPKDDSDLPFASCSIDAEPSAIAKAFR